MVLLKTPLGESLVTIEHLNDDGEGIGQVHLEGRQPAFGTIPGALPQEKILCSVLKKKRGAYLCHLKEIISANSERQTPACPHFNFCGGCTLQHLTPSAQLNWKVGRVEKLFAPYLLGAKMLSPLTTDSSWHYRSKMEFTFATTREGVRKLGLYHRRGRVTDIEVCPIAPEWMTQTLVLARLWWHQNEWSAFNAHTGDGCLRTLTLRQAQQGAQKMVILSVAEEIPIDHLELKALSDILQKEFENICFYLRWQIARKGCPTRFEDYHISGPTHLEESLTLSSFQKTLRFQLSPFAFFQPSPGGAQKLYDAAFQTLRIEPGDLIYDLYCGTATLGLFAAAIGAKVCSIDLCASAIKDAEKNKELNHIHNIDLICSDVGVMVAELMQRKDFEKPKTILVDPPRAGLGAQVIELLCQIQAPSILYISCNPKTQSADVKEILKYGYALQSLQVVDQFPQTLHTECIAYLTRIQKSP